MQRDRVLYFYPEKSPFIQKDILFLTKNFSLQDYPFNLKKKWMLPWVLIRQFFILFFNIKKSTHVICRFGGYHAILPVLFSKIFNKNDLIILGGVECHCLPEIKYGFCTNKILKKIMYLTQKYTKKILIVHQSLYECSYQYFDTAGKQGLKNLYGTDRQKVFELKNGYDNSIFYNRKLSRKNMSFITAPGRIDAQTFQLKGVDLIMELCRRIKEIKVTVVGDLHMQILDIPDNIQFVKKLKPESLAELYNRHEYYFQLSMAEGFPNSLCEAMLCGCIPIGSDVFGIPEIIGDTGFLLRKKNIDELIQIIQNLKNFDKKKLSLSAENRILRSFDLKKRNDNLFRLISSN